MAVTKRLIAGRPSGWYQLSKTADWFVYTMYESQRRIKPPLYVGVTSSIYERLSQHRKRQAWWPLVGDIDVETFGNKEDAYEAEDRRIYELKPLLNIANNLHTPRLEVSSWPTPQG